MPELDVDLAVAVDLAQRLHQLRDITLRQNRCPPPSPANRARLSSRSIRCVYGPCGRRDAVSRSPAGQPIDIPRHQAERPLERMGEVTSDWRAALQALLQLRQQTIDLVVSGRISTGPDSRCRCVPTPRR